MILYWWSSRVFQSTHSHGVRRSVDNSTLKLNKFQSTHSHGVRLTIRCTFSSNPKFQSTHSHGVRLQIAISALRFTCFNPRTHMECDATTYCYRPDVCRFNPRTHMECDNVLALMIPIKSSFQSTHSHGVRHIHRLDNIFANCFNPRTHMECDVVLRLVSSVDLCFNPRTHMECDAYIYAGTGASLGFNPRTHMECDSRDDTLCASARGFQSTHSHGVRPSHPLHVETD